MRPEDVCKQELEQKIAEVEGILRSAKDCLKDKNYMQCAIRLQDLICLEKYNDFTMDIFFSLTTV